MANGELIDAREAMGLLGIGEGDLQNLVARGDLRAFRSAGTMKFRREDVVGLKNEKQTEPTIIIPAVSNRKPGASGILAAVPPPSGIRPAAGTPAGSAPSDQTGTILFDGDDLNLGPVDDAMNTQHATVVGSAVTTAVGDEGGATMVDTAAQATGEMTVVDEAQVSTGPASPVAARPARKPGSGIAQPVSGGRVGSQISPSPMQGPAVSRVNKPAVSASRRAATVYQQKTAHPVFTAFLILQACVMLFVASIFFVSYFKGHYDAASGQRIIPPFLKDVFEMNYNGNMFGSMPGKTNDTKAPDEFSGDKKS